MSAMYWLASFLNVPALNRVWLWFQKIFTKWTMFLLKEQTLSSTDSIRTTAERSLTDHQFERVTRFDDLPDELLLIICRYLSPPHVLNAFLDCNGRTFCCISDYRTNINLTKWSYTDLQSILGPIDRKRLVLSVLTLSNSMISKQIEYLSSEKCSLKFSCFSHVHRLSLLNCTESNILSLQQILPNFPRLRSLRIVDCASNNYKSGINTLGVWLRDLIFGSPLTTIKLIVNIDIILNKQIVPNERLTRLVVSLKTIDDLLVLIDGLVPNLIVLDVTLCDTRVSTRSLLPPGWPHQTMSHLTEFELTTKKKAEWKLEYLLGTVMVFRQLHTLLLVVENWISDDDNHFPSGNQIETIITQYMPHLQYFYCDIQTKCDVDMETFVGLNQRWPMAYRIDLDNSSRYLYTVPWPFRVLRTSTLADNDTTSVCPRVLGLIVDVPCANLSQRFPNIKTLMVLSNCTVVGDFRRLRELTTMNIEMLSSLTERIHTLTLMGTGNVLIFSNIYPNVYHLVIEDTKIDSSTLVADLVTSFPSLRSLNIQFLMSKDYFDSLNMILDGQHLPHLAAFATNWIDQHWDNSWKINEWLLDKTILKWRTTPFYVSSVAKDQWTVWL